MQLGYVAMCNRTRRLTTMQADLNFEIFKLGFGPWGIYTTGDRTIESHTFDLSGHTNVLFLRRDPSLPCLTNSGRIWSSESHPWLCLLVHSSALRHTCDTPWCPPQGQSLLQVEIRVQYSICEVVP